MATPKHILVIRLSAMGDVAMIVPVLRVVAQTYPDVKITVLSKQNLAPLFAEIPNVHFIAAEVKGQHKGFLGLLKLAKQVKKLGVDSVADLHNVIRSKIVTKRLSLAGVKIATLNKGRAEKKKLTSANGMGLVQLTTTHERYAAVFEKLGLPIDLSSHQYPERKRLSPRINTIMGEPNRKCIGIAPFAAYTSKMYPLELTKQVMAQLNEDGKYHLLLFGGGASEIEQLDTLSEGFYNVTNIAGTLTFEEELDLISNLDLMLAMDSSNGHLAALNNIPVITLWGVTHPFAGFVPFNQPHSNQLMANRNDYPLIPTSIYGNNYPEGYENAMQSIAVHTIVEKIKTVV